LKKVELEGRVENKSYGGYIIHTYSNVEIAKDENRTYNECISNYELS
jgi:hypothetical protein